MEDKDVVTKGMEDAQEQNLPKMDLERRLVNWRNERPITRYGERKARGLIASAMTRDLHRQESGKTLTAEVIQSSINASVKKLEDKLKNQSEIVVHSLDSVTKEPFNTKISKTNNGWLAEELKPDGTVITQARINQSGQTELTLHFSNDRYEERDANLNVTCDTNFPEATAQVFNLLTSVVLNQK